MQGERPGRYDREKRQEEQKRWLNDANESSRRRN